MLHSWYLTALKSPVLHCFTSPCNKDIFLSGRSCMRFCVWFAWDINIQNYLTFFIGIFPCVCFDICHKILEFDPTTRIPNTSSPAAGQWPVLQLWRLQGSQGSLYHCHQPEPNWEHRLGTFCTNPRHVHIVQVESKEARMEVGASSQLCGSPETHLGRRPAARLQ